MRHGLWALGFACAFGDFADAQQPSPLGGGQVVSSGYNLGQAVPRIPAAAPAAAPAAGNSVSSPTFRPYDPSRPLDVFKGTNLSAKNVVAPVTGLPGTKQPDMLDRLYDKLGTVTRFFKPSPSEPMMSQPVTPGIFRRNRERNKMEWRRD